MKQEEQQDQQLISMQRQREAMLRREFINERKHEEFMRKLNERHMSAMAEGEVAQH